MPIKGHPAIPHLPKKPKRIFSIFLYHGDLLKFY